MGTPILTIYCSHLLTELSSVVEQLAYIQCVGGSIPPVPIFRKENEKNDYYRNESLSECSKKEAR